MAGVNKVILIGNLGKDPDIVSIDANIKKASFSMATTESYRNREGQRVDQTEWHNIVMWRGLAEIAEKYLHKGSKVYIEGRLRTRDYEDKEGIKRYRTEILADSMVMLDKAENTGNGYQQKQNSQEQPKATETQKVAEEAPEDDLPF